MDLRYLLDVIAKAVLSDDFLEQLHVHQDRTVSVSVAPGACISEALFATIYVTQRSTAYLHFLVQSHNHGGVADGTSLPVGLLARHELQLTVEHRRHHLHM